MGLHHAGTSAISESVQGAEPCSHHTRSMETQGESCIPVARAWRHSVNPAAFLHNDWTIDPQQHIIYPLGIVPAVQLQPRDPSICNFIHEDKNEVRWICNNQRATHPVTGKLFDKCGWHTLECIGKHNDHDRPRIEFPNADGLCKAHFFAKHTDEPPQVAFLDTPGIAILNPEHFKAHMKRAKLNEDHDSQGELFDEDMTFDDSTQ